MKSTYLNKGLFFFLLLLIIISCAIGQHGNSTRWYKAKVVAVIDGDTIKVQMLDTTLPTGWSRIERVRLIGVNTPELTTKPPQYYAQEARRYTDQFYAQTVYLELDTVSAERDKYGRLLAYVYNDASAMPINKQLIAGGYGRYYGVFQFNPERMYEFQKMEEYARQNKYGLWK